VCEALWRAICSGVPSATIWPPPAPLPGRVDDPVCFGDEIKIVLDDNH